MTLLGIVPFVALMFTDWVRIQAGYLGTGDSIGVNNLNLFTSLGEVAEAISVRVFTPNEVEASKAFVEDFMNFSWIFTLMAVLAVAAVLLTLLAASACRNVKTRAALSYSGFALSAVCPLVFIYAINAINAIAGQRALQASPFPYLALLAGLLSMVYFVKLPVLTAVKNKRNSVLTRVVTTFVPVKGDGAREGLRKVVFTTALVSFIYFASTLGVDLYEAWKDYMNQKRNNQMFNMEVDLNDDVFKSIRELKPLPDYLALYAKNNDMVGYVRLGETRLDYPVVQTANNEYYLENAFDKTPNKYGAIFADYRNSFDGLNISDNTILYGHNCSTGNMFAPLSNFHSGPMRDDNLNFYKKNPVVIFDSLFEKMEWKVFACVLFNTEDKYGEVYKYLSRVNFDDENDFHGYILDIMDRSVIFADVDLKYGDDILTLSTCYWPYGGLNTRCVVFARRVRKGESSYVDVEKATINTKNLRFREEANRIGTNWNGRVWDYKKYLTSYKE
jgi:sortase B